MINIYTDKKESKDWILQNDLYFLSCLMKKTPGSLQMYRIARK